MVRSLLGGLDLESFSNGGVGVGMEVPHNLDAGVPGSVGSL